MLLILAYPLLVHLGVWLDQPFMLVFALLVLTVGLLLPGLRRGSGFTWGLFLAALVLIWLAGYLDVALYLLFLPPVIIPLVLLGIFLNSLLPGQTPLVTAIAQKVRGSLSQQLRDYTRNVTLMWTVVFAGISLASILLPWLTTATAWSLFTNFIGYLLVGILFIGEFIYRKWRFREYKHPRFADYVRIVVDADIRKR